MAQEISFLQIDPTDLRLPVETSVNPQTGGAVTAVGIPITSGRNGFQPTLNLTYNSGGGNSVFGMGWNLQGIPIIGLSLKDGYPKYDGSDKFSFGGQELIPWLEEVAGEWQPRTAENANFFVTYFRTTVDSSFTRFEQWKDKTSHKIHWRIHGTNNSVMVFGQNPDHSTKVLDVNDPNRIFQWLLETQYDNMGNAITYEYVEDDYANVDGSSSFERNRIYKGTGNSQKYLRRIRYGNTIPMLPDEASAPSQQWLFEVVLDYGDHGDNDPSQYYATAISTWPTREDPFSSYIAGFEQRTYRLCRRVLMFHNMAELGAGPTLVGNTKLFHNPNPAGTTLDRINYTGYRRIGADTYDSKTMPPVLFNYTSSEIERSFQQAPQQSNANVPIGLNGLNYKWADLYGEGLSGVLYESNDAWYYKPNLGGGNLGPQHQVAKKPSLGFGSYALSDFDGDGNLNLVVLQGRESGFFEYNRDKEVWDGFKSFQAAPHVRQMDTNTQLIDLTGNGRSDIITTEEDRIIWYPSKGKEGFGAPFQIAKAISNGVSRAPTLGSNPMLDYFFADMNGSGLPDQVHIYNGKVEYWPNLGNGKFGAGIVMANAPQLDFDFELDASRMRLVDLDGSGTSDLIYLGRGEIRYWINACGNQFLEENTLRGLPVIDNISSAQILDFLGNGTPCLVWSSALAMHANAPIHYLQLTNGVKPRLMQSMQNNMGLETRFHYGYSAQHYLRDKTSDAPWITKLPSHQTVVDRLETIDHIGKTRFNQLYEYHDGFFDGEERAFRGFCLVDQYDSDIYLETSGIPETAFTDPVCVRTWYHNGAPGWQKSRNNQYYVHDTYSRHLKDSYIEGNKLGADEFYNAIRSLAGQTFRTETYGILSDGKRKEHPFQVNHSNYAIRQLQPKQDNYDAGFAVFESESLNINFEENPEDPHIAHSFSVETDAYGVPLKQASVVYPRIHLNAKSAQQVFHINGVTTAVVHFDARQRYEIGIPLESKSFEFKTDTFPPDGVLFTRESIARLVNETISRAIAFNESFTLGDQVRLLQWNQSFYWNSDRTSVLAHGEVGRKVLPHHQETACFNTEFLEDTLGTLFNSAMIPEGGYVERDDFWWQPSAVIHFDGDNQFYLPLREVQSNAAFVEYEYDDYQLVLTKSTNVLVNDTGDELARNSVSSVIDYHLLAPNQIEDANRNISEVQYDPLGVVLISSMYGELLSTSGTPEMQGHGRLSDYTEPTDINFDQIISNPAGYIQECASFFYYELDTWQNDQLPLRSLALAREQWVHDGEGNYHPQSTYQINVDYQDGFARSIQTKTLVEPGPDTIQYDNADSVVLGNGGEPELVISDQPRWRVSGHVVYNNKQQPVEQYEPYFSPRVAFESAEVLNTFGVSGELFYDAIGREKKVHFADGTENKISFHTWTTQQYDANDAIVGSLYENINSPLLDPDSPEASALQKSIAHNDTPVTSFRDGLGRVFLIEEDDENGRTRANRTIYDTLGNPKEVIDARNLTAFTYAYDMQGRLFHETSMDSGEKWQFINALDQPIHLWDARDVHQQLYYDTWGRVTHKQVYGALNMNHITERFIYGKDASILNPWEKNLVGQLVEHYDQAGLNRIHRLDILGNILEKDRRLVEDYKSIPDWSDMTSIDWMIDPPFETKATYDALGRPLQQQLPDSTTRKYTYLQSGAVDRLLLTTADGAKVDEPITQGRVSNAYGQTEEFTLGNDVVQRYEYDGLNKRLKRKTSFRRAKVGLPAKQYQNIRYTYDAVGNITHLIDTARPNSTLLYNQPRINQYIYDAFYQLTEAEGRTHRAMERTDYAHAPDAPGFIKGTRHISINNMNLVRNYTRAYSYDLNGNMESMIHSSGTSPNTLLRWRRDFLISENSNRTIESTDLAGLPISIPPERFDANGNLIYLSHLRNVEWNYLNQLTQAIIIERANDADNAEFYVYGGDGQRVRKVTQRLDNNSIETTEKIYLDGCEIKRIKRGDTPILERYTSHLSDGNERVALMHRWTVDTYRRETDDISQKKMHYQLSCHLGSSAFELDEDGEIISYEEYFAFGGSAFVFGTSLRDVQLKEYRYSGKERDDATGLYYYGFRYYAPWLCRWLNPDPIGPEDGLNVYQFVHNNPINEVDPDGLQAHVPERTYHGTESVMRPDGTLHEIVNYSELEEVDGSVQERRYTVDTYRDENGRPQQNERVFIGQTNRTDLMAERDGNYLTYSQIENEDNQHDLPQPIPPIGLPTRPTSLTTEPSDDELMNAAMEGDSNEVIDQIMGDIELQDLVEEILNELNQQEQNNQGGIYQPYGNNEFLNYTAGAGEAFVNKVGLTSEGIADTIVNVKRSIHRDIHRFERGDTSTRLEIIDSYNIFGHIRDFFAETYQEGARQGEGGDSIGHGLANVIETINPAAYIRDFFSETYQEGARKGEGGDSVGHGLANVIETINPVAYIRDFFAKTYQEGARQGEGGDSIGHGLANVVETVNPFAHIRNFFSATIDAIERGDSYGAGINSTNAILTTAATVAPLITSSTAGLGASLEEISTFANSNPYSARNWREHLESVYGRNNVRSTTVPARSTRGVRTRAEDLGSGRSDGLDEIGRGRSVGHDERGIIDFDPYSVASARVGRSITYRGEMRAATRQLRELLGKERLRNALASGRGVSFNGVVFTRRQIRAIIRGRQTIPGYRWHHVGGGRQLQLIPQRIHRFGHVGSGAMRHGR